MIDIRKKIKSRKPKFVRQDIHKKKKLKKNWRVPRGLQSKVRLHKKGYRRSVTPGYGSPRSVKGLHGDGVEAVTVFNVSDMQNISKEKGMIIGASVGQRKRVEILRKALESKIKVLNINDPQGYIKSVEDKLSKKKAKKQKEKKAKEEKEKKLKEEAEKKKTIEETLTDEEKKKKEKQEKDKLLTKRE